MLAVDRSIMHGGNTPSLSKSSMTFFPTEGISSSWNVGWTGKELALGEGLATALITALLLILAGDVETNPGPTNGNKCLKAVYPRSKEKIVQPFFVTAST